MSYTRRSILRDAALVSIAGASGVPMFGECQAPSPSPRPSGFSNDGIRIFFCGAWLFSADKSAPDTRILATTLDLCPSTGPACHRFPHGVWSENACFDAIDTQLSPIKAAGFNSHEATVSGATTKYKHIDELFGDMLCANPLTYVSNPGQKYSVHTGLDTVRAISLPFPTSIIPAAFIVNSSIEDPNGRLQSGPSNPRVAGLATVHIFVYDGATLFSLSDGGGTQVGSATKSQNYHFHTVPVKAADVYHPPMMFRALLGMIDGFNPADLTLPLNYYPAIQGGPDTPITVSDQELELETQFACISPANGDARKRTNAGSKKSLSQRYMTNRTLASCASHGIVLGNGGM